MRIIIYSSLFLASLVLALVLVPLVRRLALKANITDNPSAGRKDHRTAMPLLGGLAIYLAFMLVILTALGLFLFFGSGPAFAAVFEELSRQRARLLLVLPKLLALLAGSVPLVLIGWLDDKNKHIDFSPRLKLIAQVVAASIAIIGGVQTQFMPAPGLNFLVSLVWIVGITNAFNFLDNMDGLAAGIAAIAAAIFCVVTAMQGQFFSAMILATLTGSLVGFLRYNFHPASIFMGDLGSLFIGYMLGALTVTSSYVVPGSPSLIPVIMPLLILSVPLYDTLTVIYIRIRERQPIYIGDKRHFSHRLVRLGFTPRSATIYMYLICFGIAIAAMLLPYVSVAGSLIIILQTIVVYILLTILIHIGGKKNNQDRVNS